MSMFSFCIRFNLSQFSALACLVSSRLLFFFLDMFLSACMRYAFLSAFSRHFRLSVFSFSSLLSSSLDSFSRNQQIQKRIVFNSQILHRFPLLTRAFLHRYFRHDFHPVFTQSDDFLAWEFDSWRGSLPYTALTF